jgi:hypothetical protein
MPRTYKPEDVEFYKSQERLCKYVSRLIETSGYSTELYVPPGGWRRGDIDKERSQDPYPNQLLVALRIFYYMFCSPSLAVLIYVAALFQGGKSGVIQALTRLILTNANKLMNRYGVAIITAMNDLAWFDQTISRIVSEFKDQIYHLGTLKKFINSIEENKQVNGGQAKNIFIIDDESRVGSKKRNIKGDILASIKETTPFDTWRENNIRYLYVDATDPAVAINMTTLSQQGLAKTIVLELPPSYLSIKKLREQNRIHQSHNLLVASEVESFRRELLNIYGLEPLWHLVRMPNTRSEQYEKAEKLIREKFGDDFEYVTWNSSEKNRIVYEDDDAESQDESLLEINTHLASPPVGGKPAFIFLKNMFYAGKTLNDTYVGAMHDRSSEQDDVTGQSFAGRASGHNRSSRTHIWTNVAGIDRLIHQWQDIILMDDDDNERAPREITRELDNRMPHVSVGRALGSQSFILQTSGEEISRPENLRNQQVVNIPTRLRGEHMLESPPLSTKEEAMRIINDYYGTSFRVRMKPKDGYYLNSRLLSWYKKQYPEIATAIASAPRGQKAAVIQPRHRITQEQFASIAKTFGCSSRTGQPYLLYPVYPNNTTSPGSTVKWYVRYIKKEYTRYSSQIVRTS